MNTQTVFPVGFVAPTAITIALNSIANSEGQQGTFIDNRATRYKSALIYVKIRMNGASAATANSVVEVYLLRSDADGTSEHRSDGAGASDADIWVAGTALDAPGSAYLLGVCRTTSTPAVDEYVYGEFFAPNLGPKWTIGVYNRTGQTTGSTAGDHSARYIGLGAGQGS